MPPLPHGTVDPLYPLARTPGAGVEAALAAALAELDRFGVERAGISLDDDAELARAALTAHPARFFARTEADPLRGMDELRRIERLARELGLRAVTASPARLRVPVDDRRFYPLLAKCAELGLVFCPSLGIPAERVPFAPQKLERIDAVACFFPELRIAMRDGGLPWERLAVLLLRRHPNLAYLSGRLLPSELPAELVAFANEDGAHQVLFASAAAGCEASHKELPGLGLARAVWPRFLRENALRLFRLAS